MNLQQEALAAPYGRAALGGAALREFLAGALRRLAWRARPDVLLAGGGNRNDGPPDLDELWRDFNRRLGGLFGGGRGRRPEGGFSRT